jgi:RNA polymerase sigma-70 factor (ECF subfamily)
MPQDGGFQELIRRVRAGDDAAAWDVVRRYEPAIRRAARIRLADSGLRRVFDSMDICQSVFASFFFRAALGQYELDHPEQLLKLLVSMTRKKLVNHFREEHAAKRDRRRLRVSNGNEIDVAGTAAAPADEVAARELLEEFRRRLSQEERQLAEQRARGDDWNEIAAEHGASADALRKRLTRAVDRVAEEMGLGEMLHG